MLPLFSLVREVSIRSGSNPIFSGFQSNCMSHSDAKSVVRAVTTGIAFSLLGQVTGSACASDVADDIFSMQSSDEPQVLRLDDVFGKAPKTIFVPGRLYKNGKGALFIDGKRFVARSGATDVQGFIWNGSAYLIAVRDTIVGQAETTSPADGTTTAQMFTEEELKKLPPEMRLKALQLMGSASVSKGKAEIALGNGKPNATVFHRCTSVENCEIVYSVKGTPPLQISEEAMWFNDPGLSVRAGAGNSPWLVTYAGLDTSGRRLDGPSSVLSAALLPNGAWLIKKFVRADSVDTEYSWVVRTANGLERAVLSYADSARDTQLFEVPKSIVVNAVPVSTSARFGVLSVTSGGHDRLTSSSRAYYKPICAYTARKESLHGDIFFGDDSRAKIAFLASQLVVVPADGKVRVFGQARISGKTALGMLELECREGGAIQSRDFDIKALALISKDGFSFSNGLPKTDGLGGFLHIRYPSDDIVLLTERMKEGKPFPGIRLGDGKRIPASDAQRFIELLGIVND